MLLLIWNLLITVIAPKKMGIIINSRESYNLAFTCSWDNLYLGNVRKGAFLEIDKLLETKGKEIKSVIDERFWEGAKIDGKTYARYSLHIVCKFYCYILIQPITFIKNVILMFISIGL